MTDFASLLVADRGQKARPIHLVDKESFAAWLKKRPAEDRALLEAQRFDGKTAFAFALLPRGGDFEVVSAVKNAGELSPWCLAKLAESLPEGTYRLAEGEPGMAALGWLLAQHQFDAYRSKKDEPERGPARAGHRRAGADRRRRSASPKRPRWSATWSTRPPPISARPRSKRRCATKPSARAGTCGSRPATSSPRAIR